MINYKRLRSLSEKRVKELEEIILEKELNLRNAPEGTLRTCRCKKTTQYFIRKEENDKTGQYIKKKDIALAERLAQKEYDERVLKAAREELKFWQEMKSAMPEKIDYINERIEDLLNRI